MPPPPYDGGEVRKNSYAIALPAGGGGPPRLRSAQAKGRRGTRSANTKSATVMNTESPSALRAPPPAGQGYRMCPRSSKRKASFQPARLSLARREVLVS